MRLTRLTALVVAALAAACGDDPFSVEDALGVWELRGFNGIAVDGNRPTGVWLRESGGSDSTLTVLQSLSIEFSSGSVCSWTFDDGISTSVTQDDCEYAVAPDGVVSLDLLGLLDADRSLTGTAEADSMSLADMDANLLQLRKRL